MIVAKKFVLTGVLEGQTTKRGGFQFVDGALVFVGEALDADHLSHFLRVNYKVKVEDLDVEATTAANATHDDESVSSEADKDLDLEDPDFDWEGPEDSESVSSEADQSAGSGHGRPSIEEILKGLDPEDGALWTTTGKPSMAAIENAYGSKDVSRRDVEKAIPGFNRSAARALRN